MAAGRGAGGRPPPSPAPQAALHVAGRRAAGRAPACTCLTAHRHALDCAGSPLARGCRRRRRGAAAAAATARRPNARGHPPARGEWHRSPRRPRAPGAGAFCLARTTARPPTTRRRLRRRRGRPRWWTWPRSSASCSVAGIAAGVAAARRALRRAVVAAAAAEAGPVARAGRGGRDAPGCLRARGVDGLAQLADRPPPTDAAVTVARGGGGRRGRRERPARRHAAARRRRRRSATPRPSATRRTRRC